MLPATPATARSLVGVADDLFAAVREGSEALGRAQSVVLVVIDGLGALALRAHAGHARHLTAGLSKKDTAVSVFPTTTAAALTSIVTGAHPGEHGLVGYRVLDRSRDRLVNQLTEWESVGIDPATWQGHSTIFERAAAAGHATFAVGVAAYAHSGFTHATLRGATFVAAETARERVAVAYALAADNPGAVVYCYLPEVDKAGHRYGVASDEWLAALEDVDSALAHPVPAGVGVAITADHGMIDVPPHRQLVLEAGSDCFDGVRHIGGEPRMMHVYAELDADVDTVAARWSTSLGKAADVLSGRDAIAAGLFGPTVGDAARQRIGDVIAIARSQWALYDGTAEDQRGRGMIGQHGALTPEERHVPFIRRGAFAR